MNARSLGQSCRACLKQEEIDLKSYKSKHGPSLLYFVNVLINCISLLFLSCFLSRPPLTLLSFSPSLAGRTVVYSQQENVTLDTGQVGVGQRAGQTVPAGVFWRSRLAMEEPNFLKFNISIHKNALIGVYGRKGLPPTHTQVSRAVRAFSQRAGD